MEFCCAYKEREPCPKRHDCVLFSEFFIRVRDGYFKNNPDKPMWLRAPYQVDSKLGFKCLHFKQGHKQI